MKKICLIAFTLVFVLVLGGCDDFDEVSVMYSSNEGNDILRITIKEGDILVEPDIPIKEGHTFLGWYSREDTDEYVLYDFDAPVQEDITLYARYEINQYTMTFRNQYGDKVSQLKPTF